MNKKISVLGCGWLGLPLAIELLKRGASVKGSTTTVSKIPVLHHHGIEAFEVTLAGSVEENFKEFLLGSDTLVINIPPKIRSGDNFLKKIQNIIPTIERSTVRHVIFVSSTSVYGESPETFDETSTPRPESESGKQLLEVENLLKSNSNFELTIVRPGGLIGEDRHPVKSLSGRTNIPHPLWPVNLVHREDLIEILIAAVNGDFIGKIVNAVAPCHESRHDFYRESARRRNLELPQFDMSDLSQGKRITTVFTKIPYNPTLLK